MRKLKNIAHLLLALAANILCGFPGKKLKVIGVTGTDGKTTTASLIHHILNSAGRKSALVTTVGAVIDGKRLETGLHVTTPSAFTLQRFLRRALAAGQEFAVLETSSHGIDQHRIFGISYLAAVITNVTREHLDYHKDFTRYKLTKLRLLKSAKTAVVNLDDPEAASLLPELPGAQTYSLRQPSGTNLANFPFQTGLFGEFNLSNCLAATAVCRLIGLSDDQIRAGIRSFQAPSGRQELVFDGPFKIMVDFAHTPNSLENVLRAAKQSRPKRLIHVFGAPGRRDSEKRPLMGRASARYADLAVLTADDPRDESVKKIIGQIKAGMAGFPPDRILEIENRRQAIEKAISLAEPGDFLLLTGKGHEPTLAVGTDELPWNEPAVVKEILQKK